jgi:putative phage-type endonuclease
VIDHTARAKGIGASELAAILGLDPYRTPLDVWMEKTGRKPQFMGNEATFRGNALEDAVGAYMQRELGEDWKQIKGGQFVHPDFPVIRCNPDRLYRHRQTGEKIGGELKTTIEKVQVEDLQDPENPKKVPWLFQCQWCMIVTGCTRWELGWMGAYFNYQQVTINYDEAFAKTLIRIALDWWERHIIQDIQPEPINAADAANLWPKDDGNWFEASPMLAETITKYANAKAQERQWKATADALADRIKLAFGPSMVATSGGERIASYKENRTGNRTLRIHL